MKKVIAFVDDEVETHEIVKVLLSDHIESNGYDLQTFNDGSQLLDYTNDKNNSPPILVLSDINMPIMDGLTMLEKLKELHPKIDVVMQSAYGSQSYRERAKRLGASAFLEKPINFEEVKVIIDKKINEPH